MIKLVRLFSLLFLCQSLNAQVFTSNIAGPILDDGLTTSEFLLIVKNLNPSQIDSNFGIKKICIDLNHPSMDQLEIWVSAPNGNKVKLGTGLSGSDFHGCFDMNSGNFVSNNGGPYQDVFRPISNIGYLNSKTSSNGNWKLLIKDRYRGQNGTLISWSITFGANPPKASSLYLRSKLPIIRINTQGNQILDNPKSFAEFELVNNTQGATNGFNDTAILKNKIGIELRGSSSQWFPKKSYGFEFVDSIGEEMSLGLLGMPEESDWILSANFTDKSFMNNVLAYELYRDLGHYAARTRFVDLFINNEHQGLYVLMEKIKQNKNRVNISKLNTEDTSAKDITGGYIFKIDKPTGGNNGGWVSKFQPIVHPNNQIIYYQFHYPNEENINQKQKKYIDNAVYKFENSLQNEVLGIKNMGWRLYADEASFIHYFLLNEMSRNTDGYRLSTFLYKASDDKGGKISVGPPWDYDIAFGNINYCNGQETTGWAIDFGNFCSGDYSQVPFWWEKLLNDSLFTKGLKCEYLKLRSSSWSNKALEAKIDQHVVEISEAAEKNFDLWSILGLYIWPNNYPFPTNFQANVTYLKTWLFKRLEWMDKNMPGICLITESKDETNNISKEDYTIFPNPSNGEIQINLSNIKSNIKDLRIYDLHGILKSSIEFERFVDLNKIYTELPSGVYITELNCDHGLKLQKKFILLK
ncbi:MAG: CotH kinase family protein [Saprospiraceae bacterium]